MAFEWVAGLFQSEQTRGLSGDSAHTVALDDANPYYNYRLRRHKAEGDVIERPSLLWYTSPYVKRRQGLGTHVAGEVGEGVANYTDVLLILSAEDYDRAPDAWPDEATRVLQGEFETYCRREGFSRLHAHRPVAFRILRDGSEEMGGQQLGLGASEFVTGLLPNLYTGPVRGSFPVIGVNVNLPGVWEGYQEVGRLYNDQILFTLGSHWLDNFQHPSLEQAALYRLRQYPDGSFVHIVNPDLQDSYQVTTANQGGASVLTLASRAGKPLAYIVLAVIDPPSTRPSMAPGVQKPPQLPPPPSSKPPASSSSAGVPSIAPPMMAEEEPSAPQTGATGLGGKTIVPDAPSERIFTLQERGAMLQKVHFSAFMLGYDVYLGKRGELGTHVDDPAATFQVRKRSVSIVAHIDGVNVGGRPVPPDVEVPIEGDMGIAFNGQRFEYRDLRWVKAESWPYVGEIRRPASSTYMIWGEEYQVGRSRECRVVLPDEPRNENIHWKPSMGDGATIRTRTKEIPKSRFYTDSIMVASEHATIDLKGESPAVVCTANHCYVYVRRDDKVDALYPQSSDAAVHREPLQPGDEVLIGNCLFHVGFTPASEATATAPAPRVELPEPTEEPSDHELADAVEGPDMAALDSATPAPSERTSGPPSIAPPAMFDPSDAPPAADEGETDLQVGPTPSEAQPPGESENFAASDDWDEEEATVRGITIPEPPGHETPPPPVERVEADDVPPPPPPEAMAPPPLPDTDTPEEEQTPPPLDSSMLDELEEASDDEPTTPGMVLPADLDGPAYEPSSALHGEVDATGEEPFRGVERGPDVGGWDQDDWDSTPKGLGDVEEDESVDDGPTGSAKLPLADVEDPPSTVPAPFPDIRSADTPPGAPEGEEPVEDGESAGEAEEVEEPDAEETVEEVPELPRDAAALDTLRISREALEEKERAAEPVEGGEVVFMDDSEAQFELGRPLHLVQSGWMLNGEVVAGNHRGVDLILPENRIVEDQTFTPRDYFRLKVRGRRATLTLLAPGEVLIDEADPEEEVYSDVDKRIIDVIRRDDLGEEDFAVRLHLRQDKALPDPRARLLAIDVDDPLAAALVTRGIPKASPRTLELGNGLHVTLTFDGETVHVSDYMDTYKLADGFRPFFVQRDGKRFITAPEDGAAFELHTGDRIVVDASVYVLRQE